jgi:hypothetical protein
MASARRSSWMRGANSIRMTADDGAASGANHESTRLRLTWALRCAVAIAQAATNDAKEVRGNCATAVSAWPAYGSVSSPAAASRSTMPTGRRKRERRGVLNQRSVPAKRNGRDRIQPGSPCEDESDISVSFPATRAPRGWLRIRPHRLGQSSTRQRNCSAARRTRVSAWTAALLETQRTRTAHRPSRGWEPGRLQIVRTSGTTMGLLAHYPRHRVVQPTSSG